MFIFGLFGAWFRNDNLKIMP
uniref:Uncharacterized protein n=1 Tax=Rhizophora mucronata TaxID=61149 RepID=A0A2P2QSX3_RHIMU